jgi:hypothetical protein
MGMARRVKPHQHDSYPDSIVRTLPYAHGLLPTEAVTLVENSPWGPARYERLADIEQAMMSDRGLLAEILGTPKRWSVSAGS